MVPSRPLRAVPTTLLAVLLAACGGAGGGGGGGGGYGGGGGGGGATPLPTEHPDTPSQTSTEHLDTPSDTSTEHLVTVTAGPAPTVEVTERLEHRFEMQHVDFLAEAAGAVWVKEDRGPLHRLDPRTNEVVASIEVEVPGEAPCAGIGASEDVLWVCAGGGHVARVDTATDEVLATVQTGKLFDQGPIPVAFDHAWVIADGGTSLVGVSNATNEVDVTFDLGTRCTNVAASTDALWVACRPDSVVLRVDPTSGQETARVEGLTGPATVAFDEVVWVGHDEGTVRIDPGSSDVTGVVDVGPGGFNGSLVAAEGEVWIRTEAIFLRRLDGTSLELLEDITAPEQSGGSVLLAFGSVWATAYSEGVLYRLAPEG
jgi:streptogramin lyase